MHVREDGGLRLQAGASEMTRGIHDWGTWYTGLLPGLFWGLLQRRSGVQMLLLPAAGLLSSLPGSLLQMASPRSQGGAMPLLQLPGGGRVPLLTCVRFTLSGWLSSRVSSRFLYGLPGVFVLLFGADCARRGCPRSCIAAQAAAE